MHELSIATRLVEVLDEFLETRAPGAGVQTVHVRVGVLAGVVPQALYFSYDAVTAGTRLEGSCLEIEAVPLVVWCPTCQTEQTLEEPVPLCCPLCRTPTPRVLRGRELEVLAVELSEDAA